MTNNSLLRVIAILLVLAVLWISFANLHLAKILSELKRLNGDRDL